LGLFAHRTPGFLDASRARASGSVAERAGF
jgi:hypothetical protein